MRREKEEIEDLVFGVRSVIEAIDSGKEINKIMIQRGMDKALFKELKEALANKNYTLQFVPLEKLNRLTRKNHQGVIAFIAPVSYHNLSEIVTGVFERGDVPNILVLDRITDVRNFGAIARTAECTGVHAILIPDRNSATITSDAIKTSAGALFKIPVCKTRSLEEDVQFLKTSGLRIVACTEKTDNFIFDSTLTGPTAIIMGSEEDGISSELLKIAHQRAKIPLLGTIGSYNVGVSAGIVLYEKMRQMITE
ncbi:MAG TPA: 23S rRNA (guanosine(2251)-2'-O)-methyltransferase RlmB [Brumimicrobium sp.]|nr:23S rRNA (guanosine(2251)-2'-O)-methyltransferase RlmB [Brumimicrobium sp.]